MSETRLEQELRKSLSLCTARVRELNTKIEQLEAEIADLLLHINTLARMIQPQERQERK